jgi:hypothetical protein
MKNEKVVDTLQMIANGITAFSAAQGVVFAYGFSNPSFRAHFHCFASQYFTVTLKIIHGYILTRVLKWCHEKWMELQEDTHHMSLFGSITKGKGYAVWVYSVIFPMITLIVPEVYNCMV